MSDSKFDGEINVHIEPRDLDYLLNKLKEVGYGRAALAKELGVSYRTLSRWIIHKQAPRTAGLAMEYLLSWKNLLA